MEQKLDLIKLKQLDNHFDTGNMSSDDDVQSHKDFLAGDVMAGSHAEEGKFTISEISGALGMCKEDKTMSRVLNELKKCHPRIQSSAVRNGRVFQYKYYLTGLSSANKAKSSQARSSDTR